jgi:chromate transporter
MLGMQEGEAMDAERGDPPSRPERCSLAELARLFGRLGVTAFGGPAAHIAMMRHELVSVRGWLAEDDFLDLVGASNAIPGPTSTEVALHVGRRRAGGWGLLLAGTAFIVPAAVIMGVLAWFYVRYGRTPVIEEVFAGVKPVVVAIVAQAVASFARTAVKSWRLALIGAAALGAYLAGVTEPLLLFGAAALAAVLAVRPARTAPFLVMLAGVAPPPRSGASLGALAWVFLKAGALLFGSGYVLLAFLQHDLVSTHHWLSSSELLDAIAIGQFTPGPVFTTATFVGYLLAGVPGAAVATVAIFLPSFVMVAALEPLVSRMRRSPVTAAALDGLNVAAVALMAGVTWHLGQDAIASAATALLAVAALAVLLIWRLNPAWLVAGGIGVGLAAYLLGLPLAG